MPLNLDNPESVPVNTPQTISASSLTIIELIVSTPAVTPPVYGIRIKWGYLDQNGDLITSSVRTRTFNHPETLNIMMNFPDLYGLMKSASYWALTTADPVTGEPSASGTVS